MKDYVNMVPKAKQPKRRHSDNKFLPLWECFALTAVGCLAGLLVLAWLGLL